MTVHNGMTRRDGARIVDRAIASVVQQTFRSWELLAVDDHSIDGSYERLVEWGRSYQNVRPFRAGEGRGHAAARNFGLSHASGRMVTYLDAEDEFYPDYLERVGQMPSRGDIFFFRNRSVPTRHQQCRCRRA